MSINHTLFKAKIVKHLEAIKRVCKQWGCEEVALNITLIMRDPGNDDMSLIITDEADVSEICRIVEHLSKVGL